MHLKSNDDGNNDVGAIYVFKKMMEMTIGNKLVYSNYPTLISQMIILGMEI